MKGLFTSLLRNITSSVCGLCNGRVSKIDYVNDGKNGWSEKQSNGQVAQGLHPFYIPQLQSSIFIELLA